MIRRPVLSCLFLLAFSDIAQAVLVEAPPLAATAPPVAGAAADAPATGVAVAPHGGTAHVEMRIRAMHERLKISAAQEPQWKHVADVMRDDAQTIERLSDARQKNAPTLTAPEALRSYGELTAAHARGVTQLADAFDGLYATLTPAQKQTADAVFRSHGKGMPMHGGAGMHGGMRKQGT